MLPNAGRVLPPEARWNGSLAKLAGSKLLASDRVSESQLHKLIVELDFPAIYTTNYDRNLETAFEVHKKAYAKIANAKQIADAAEGVTKIVKYHGDFDDDASLVLTETDFLNRLSFDSPLDI